MSYLDLPPRVGNNASIAHAVDEPSDIAIAALINLSSLHIGSITAMAKWSSQIQWSFITNTTGRLYLYIVVGGTSYSVSTATGVFSTNGWVWVGVTRRASDGRVQFFTAPALNLDPASLPWVQIGADQILRAGDLMDASTDPVQLNNTTGGVSLTRGLIQYKRVFVGSGSDFASATPIVDADFEKQAPGTTSFTEDANGATVTVTSSTQEPAARIVGRDAAGGLYLPGRGGNYASTPAASVPLLSTELDVKVRLQLTNTRFAPQMWIVGQYTGVAAATRFLIYQNAGEWRLYVSDGATVQQSSWGGVGDWRLASRPIWIRMTWRSSDGRTQMLTSGDGESWEQFGSDGSAHAGKTLPANPGTNLTTGSDPTGATGFVWGTVERVMIADTIDGAPVFDANFAKQPRGTTSFTEDANGATVTINSSVDEPRAMITGRIG